MASDPFTMRPIGLVRSPYTETTQIPKGPAVLWVFDRAAGFELLGTPPTDTRPHGVFATRSPRRPNPIGLTVVQLQRREGSRLHVPPEDLRRGWLSEAEQRS